MFPQEREFWDLFKEAIQDRIQRHSPCQTPTYLQHKQPHNVDPALNIILDLDPKPNLDSHPKSKLLNTNVWL